MERRIASAQSRELRTTSYVMVSYLTFRGDKERPSNHLCAVGVTSILMNYYFQWLSQLEAQSRGSEDNARIFLGSWALNGIRSSKRPSASQHHLGRPSSQING